MLRHIRNEKHQTAKGDGAQPRYGHLSCKHSTTMQAGFPQSKLKKLRAGYSFLRRRVCRAWIIYMRVYYPWCRVSLEEMVLRQVLTYRTHRCIGTSQSTLRSCVITVMLRSVNCIMNCCCSITCALLRAHPTHFLARPAQWKVSRKQACN